MKFNFYPKAILRIPRFPIDADLKDYWPQLKMLIAESSPDFYETVRQLQFADIASQPMRLQHTIWKYFNRSKNRSTPFGGFASVSVVPAKYVFQQRQPLIMSNAVQMHRFVDWKQKDEVEYTYDELYDDDGLLFANSTHYIVGENLMRYIGFFSGKFEVMEMEQDDFILQMLSACRQPCPIKEVALMFPELEYDDLKERIETLVSMQLLMTSMDVNIIGEDYFSRIGYKDVHSSSQYAISERKLIHGCLDYRMFKGLDALISHLQRANPQKHTDRLGNFKHEFRNRFDQQVMPLMKVLDPEYGIGYADLERSPSQSDMIAQLATKRLSNGSSEDFKAVLDNVVSDNFIQVTGEIDLETALVGHTEPHSHPSSPIPNSMSMLCTVADGKVWVEHLGGATALALAGRFTLAIGEVEDMASDIANIEATANPEVVFFDIAYVGEGHVDNVNRRRQIYPHQLSLLNYDTSAQPITLEDVCIMLRGDELILWSRRLNKRLVPRLATAYNHTRSDLAVFRLLCDLQEQSLHSSFNLNIDANLPARNYYPRIVFRQFVLSPAKWRIRRKDLKPEEQLDDLLSRLQLPERFRSGFGDQVLYFDKSNQQDMQVLRRLFDKQQELMLEESVVPDTSIIHDQNGSPYAGQFLVQLHHSEQIYPSLFIASGDDHQSGIRRNFTLDSEWLYFEIYCHTSYSDRLLTGAISDVVEACRQYIRSWFFIRYDEGGEHIRLRIRTRDLRYNQKVAALLSRTLAPALHDGAIRDIKQCIYRREIERYGAENISYVEEHFCVDSEYILHSLREESTDTDKYLRCVELFSFCRMHIDLEPREVHAHYQRVLRSFEQEHYLSGADFKSLNELFKTVKELTLTRSSQPFHGQFEGLKSSFISTVQGYQKSRRLQLLSDLIHMHVNRLFASDQRTHEMTVYYIYRKLNRP